LQLFFNTFTFIRVVFSYSFCTVIELKLSLPAEQFWQTAKEKRLKKTIIPDEKNIRETCINNLNLKTDKNLDFSLHRNFSSKISQTKPAETES